MEHGRGVEKIGLFSSIMKAGFAVETARLLWYKKP
jgi:hypothetical protein